MISKNIDIWEGFTYEDSGNSGFRPELKTYILDGDKKRPAVLILPGGGYNHTSLREGEPVAVNYNAAGFSSFVLDYSVYPNIYPQPLLDAARAISIIRQNADEWNIDKEKIAVCGFSAGGHLAALLGVYFDSENLLKVKGIKKEFTRPNALILGYPVITSGEFAHRGSFECLLGKNTDEKLLHYMSVEKHVSERTPKSFIWHTFSDATVPMENSIMYAEALRKYNVPFEMHIYPEGRHGMALCTNETDNGGRLNLHAASWFKLSTEWLESIFN